MKKIIFLSIIWGLIGHAVAQDTLHLNGPKDNYMCSPGWFPDMTTMNWDLPFDALNMATYLYNKDSFDVYGIAAILTSYPLYAEALGRNSCHYRCIDTTLEQVGAYLRLYNPGTGSLVKHSEDLYVSLRYTPVSYYLDYNVDTLYYFSCLFDYSYYFPVYERYFETPVRVADSIYVGISNKVFQIEDTTPYEHYLVNSPFFYESIPPVYDKPTLAFQNSDSSWRFFRMAPYRFFVFPILTPGENLPDSPIDTVGGDTTHVDTTHVDTTHVDTVGISMRLLERYINLLPNPASERVQVTSSFGLLHIELYNAAGTKVLEQKATGYTATLDVRALPSGPYLARIATPSGTVTKKLVVQRR